MFEPSHKDSKSFKEHKCRLGVEYHECGKAEETGIFPVKKSCNLHLKLAKLGILTIHSLPILIISDKAKSGLFNA